MVQWMAGEEVIIKNNVGEIRKIKLWRKRIKYEKTSIYVDKILEGEEIRIDTVGERLISSTINLSGIIDTNEIDVFSLNPGDTINYYNSGLRG